MKNWPKATGSVICGFILGMAVQWLFQLATIALVWLAGRSDEFVHWYSNAGIVEKLFAGLILILAQSGLAIVIWKRSRHLAYGYISYVGYESLLVIATLVDWWTVGPG